MSLLDRVQQKKAIPQGPAQPPRSLHPSSDPGRPSPVAANLQARTNHPGQASLAPKADSVHRLLAEQIKVRLIEELAGATDLAPESEITTRISDLVSQQALSQDLDLSRQEKVDLIRLIRGEVLGLGPLEEFLSDESISEIMVNGYQQIYIEREGRLIEKPSVFESNVKLMQVITRIVNSIGRRVDESSPMVDARLRDGSRVNVIIPPLAVQGPILTIRRFAKQPYQVKDLISFGSITREMVTFLEACVEARLNIIVSGGTGSGKTTFLNVLSGFIPDQERIVTIEDAAELRLRQEHVIGLETRPPNSDGKGQITIRDLVVTALRMRPDRIVVGECRGGEALDMLQAMTTGHDGSLTTIHANSPPEMLSRLETLVMMAGTELPANAIKEQIGAAVQVIVQQARLQGGARKITSITEVHGYSNNEFKLNELFAFEQAGIDESGGAYGLMLPTGKKPEYMGLIEAEGIPLDPSIFDPAQARAFANATQPLPLG